MTNPRRRRGTASIFRVVLYDLPASIAAALTSALVDFFRWFAGTVTAAHQGTSATLCRRAARCRFRDDFDGKRFIALHRSENFDVSITDITR